MRWKLRGRRDRCTTSSCCLPSRCRMWVTRSERRSRPMTPHTSGWCPAKAIWYAASSNWKCWVPRRGKKSRNRCGNRRMKPWLHYRVRMTCCRPLRWTSRIQPDGIDMKLAPVQNPLLPELLEACRQHIYHNVPQQLDGMGVFHCHHRQSLRAVPIHQPSLILVLCGEKHLHHAGSLTRCTAGKLLLLPAMCEVQLENIPDL